MYSNGIGRTDPAGPSSSKPTDKTQRADTTLDNKGVSPDYREPTAPKDRANISADAAEIARYREMAELHREAYGPVDRSAKLDEVKARIAQGHYDRPEVIDALAGKLTDESISAPAGGENLDIIRERSTSGFYERPEVIDKTAENMVRSVIPKRES